MKRIISCVLLTVFICAFISGCTVVKKASYTLSGTVGKSNRIIGNIYSGVNYWSRDTLLAQMPFNTKEFFDENMDFIDTVEIMSATGGNENLDLYKDPLNYEVLDDYDFQPLIDCCKYIVDLGLRPSLKLGNIPLKLTGKPFKDGEFGVTVYPPSEDNYVNYYLYLKNCVQALSDEFGVEEVKTWRFGTITEAENPGWIQCTDEEFIKIYDCTVAAVEQVLGKEAEIGIHFMDYCSRTKAIFKHCSSGTNFITGESGVSLDYIDISYYIQNKTEYDLLDLRVTTVKSDAESYGLNIKVGVGEGRILRSKYDGAPLTSRILGDSYQAAMDTRNFMEAVEADIDYIWQWPNLTSAAVAPGLKLIGLKVQQLLKNTYGSYYNPMKRYSGGLSLHEYIKGFTAYNEAEDKAYAALYSMNIGGVSAKTKNISVKLDLPWNNGRVRIKKYIIDNSVNYFDEWTADYTAAGYTSAANNFGWALESPFDSNTWSSDLCKLFLSGYEKYKTYDIEPQAVESTQQIVNGQIELYTGITSDSVIYYEIELIG